MRRESVDETLLFGQLRLLARVRRFLVALAELALAEVEVVVAAVGDDVAVVDLKDLGDDAIHEVAIVRRHQDRGL